MFSYFVVNTSLIYHALLMVDKQEKERHTEFSMFLIIMSYWELPGIARRSAHFCLNVTEPGYILPVREK